MKLISLAKYVVLSIILCYTHFSNLPFSILISLLTSSSSPDNGTQFLICTKKEVFDMWSEALLQMDENTLKYQVERMQAENEKLREQSKADKTRIAELEHLLQEAQNK